MDLEERVNKLWQEIQELVEDAKKLEGKIPEGYMLIPPYYASDVEKEEEEEEEKKEIPDVKPTEQIKDELLIIPLPEPKRSEEDNLQFIVDVSDDDDEFHSPTVYYSPPHYRPMQDFDLHFNLE